MGEVTHEQVNLMLKLYDLRREPKMRQARDWFASKFMPESIEDVMKLCPPGSEENAYMRMVFSYWEMVTNIVSRGLIDEEFFFETNGEQWMVWERMKVITPAWRAMFKNPHMLSHLEKSVERMDAWREKKAPGSTEAMRNAMRQMSASAKKA